MNEPDLENKNNSVVKLEHYGRDSVQKRLDSLSSEQFNYFATLLNDSNTEIEVLKNFMADPELLPEVKVEGFVRGMAQIISTIKIEFKEKENNTEKIKELRTRLRELLKEYDF